MCGLVGILGCKGPDEERRELIHIMAATMAHRGPDGEGHVAREDCALGFRRLAIIDVEAESPPFPNEDRSIWTICNGQIYNAPDLTKELIAKGHRLRTETDTEVIPHLYEEYGADLVERLNGMFAFAVWDEPRRRLLLARDRAGEKPLYYWTDGEELVFASDLRAFLVHPRIPKALDPVALRRYLTHDFFPAPLSPLQGVRKLPAGHLLIAEDCKVTIRQYWDLADYFIQPELARRSVGDLSEELDHRLGEAVRRRSRSDVPFGLFLSGGIDSSAVLSHLAEQQGDGVPVFSIGHTEKSFDEASMAEVTARYFKADFNQLILTESDLADGLRRVGAGLGEPLGDASTIPTHLLALLAREKVKVILSGEGADELFAGYPTYIGNRVAEIYNRVPKPVRETMVKTALRLTPVSMGNVGLDYLLSRFAAAAEKDLVERHHTWFGSFSPAMQQPILAPRVLEALAGDDVFGSARSRIEGKDLPDSLSKLLYMDFTMYLQDDLLTKVDRATMLASLEARAPFLDHDLSQFAAGLPSSLKLRGKTTKDIFRRSVKRRLPADVLKRRKRGFNIPFSKWLLHGLGDELKQRFSAEKVEARGLFNSAGIAALLDEHLSGQTDHRKPLFTLLAFDLWCDATFGEGMRVPIGDAEEVTL
ncbi:MAG: asparagine synthase (glutamine-hydrolyzing) [Acidobacteria bacterium]|nr:asparagine synthase (glutamine-hydrolyzing) [Candidatus Sulfomarinibacter sp. MAG AM1]